jgi:hypothetical protein
MEPSFTDELLIQAHNILNCSKTALSDQRSLKKYFSALILCPVIMIFSYIQENDPFGRFYPLDYF